jgi:sterol desaturase/sphingolipid hydroxylase (fatty acid hydroxylase superfamily)
MAGVMMGFLWYGIFHHAIHHGRPRALAALVLTCADRHQQHHFSGQPGNFGVTIPLWDYLFGTVIHGRRVDQPGGGQKKAPIRTPAADN